MQVKPGPAGSGMVPLHHDRSGNTNIATEAPSLPGQSARAGLSVHPGQLKTCSICKLQRFLYSLDTGAGTGLVEIASGGTTDTDRADQ